MNDQVIESLLNEGESVTLDFKRKQYPFVGENDYEKSELLKDILGLANAWRRTDAYILIGVEEMKDERAKVLGIQEHLEDSDLQQFVNAKLNRPVQFHYRAISFEGKQIGVIQIGEQDRPIFLKSNFGKLKANEVYIRRGTSTDIQRPATPDEIAKMGAKPERESAHLRVEFADIKTEHLVGTQLHWNAENCYALDEKDIPDWNADIPGVRFGNTDHVMPNFMKKSNVDYLRERYHYEWVTRLYRPCRLAIINGGKTPAQKVQLEIVIPDGQHVHFSNEEDIPVMPEKVFELMNAASTINLHRMANASRRIDVTRGGKRLGIDSDDLQPGKQYISDIFYIGVLKTGAVEIKGKVYSNNLSAPHEFSLSINADVINSPLSLESLKKLP